MRGVFTTKRDTGYDDRIEERYHFPGRYLDQARRMIGDWIVYHESKRGGGAMAYIGAARVVAIEEHPCGDGFYARGDDFMPFPKPVPLRHGTGFFESRLNAVANPAKVGAALQGSSIRNISDADFSAIVMAGLHNVFDASQWRRLDVDAAELPEPRQIERVMTYLIVRDANFRDAVSQRAMRRQLQHQTFRQWTDGVVIIFVGDIALLTCNGDGRTSMASMAVRAVG